VTAFASPPLYDVAFERLIGRLGDICSRMTLPAGAELEDLQQESAARLWTAMQRWSPEQLTDQRWIRGCLWRVAVEACRALWPAPQRAVREHGLVERESGALASRLGHRPSLTELAAWLGWTEAKTSAAFVRPYQGCVPQLVRDEQTESAEDAVVRYQVLQRLHDALESEGVAWLVDVFDDCGIRQRAVDLGVSERTVRRDRTDAVARVRAHMIGMVGET
jgi:DNA-directed RNA polymerase specialized sigma24 family protein